MIRPTLVDLNPLELNYYPFIINLINSDKFSVVNMTTNKNEARRMVQQVSCDCKCKFNSTTWSSNQKMKYW